MTVVSQMVLGRTLKYGDMVALMVFSVFLGVVAGIVIARRLYEILPPPPER